MPLILVVYSFLCFFLWTVFCFDSTCFISPKGRDYCVLSSKYSGYSKTYCCDYAAIERINRKIYPHCLKLLEALYFRYYKINLQRDCSLERIEALCTAGNCQVQACNAQELPTFLFPKKEIPFGTDLDQVRYPPYERKIDYLHKLNKDFVVFDHNDEAAVFVNLQDNPERFTGYSGAHANQMWRELYSGSATAGPPSQEERKRDANLEIYHRIISGLHTSVSTHIAMNFFSIKDNSWGPSFELFHDRVGAHRERIRNLFFLYMIVLRSIAKAAKYFEKFPFLNETGDLDLTLIATVLEIADYSTDCSEKFEKNAFASVSEDALDTLRAKFQYASRIMRCLNCEKCRLWGKIQLTGIGTALKIVFSSDLSSLSLTREEVVALFNTLGRLSESLTAIDNFRTMYKRSPRKSKAPSSKLQPPKRVEQVSQAHGSSNPKNRLSSFYERILSILGIQSVRNYFRL